MENAPKFDKGWEFKLSIAKAIVSAVEREMKLAEDEISRMKPEDFKDEALRTDYMALLKAMSDGKQIVDNWVGLSKMLEEYKTKGLDDEKKEDKEVVSTSKFGFLAGMKKAA
jgi:hypothetical protein